MSALFDLLLSKLWPWLASVMSFLLLCAIAQAISQLGDWTFKLIRWRKSKP